MEKIIITVEYPEHDKVVLTNSQGDTYTSKSEGLIDFLHAAKFSPEVDVSSAARTYRSQFEKQKIVDAHLEDAFIAGANLLMSKI